MRRVAIDFAATGLRRATMAEGRVSVETVDGPPSMAAVGEWLKSYAGEAQTEVTLGCTNDSARSRPAEFWRSLARECGCRWFRVLGDHPEESPVLGIARRLAFERRLDYMAAIDVGASQASLAVVGPRGERRLLRAWDVGDDLAPCIEQVVAALQPFAADSRQTDDAGRRTMTLAGVGGRGPGVAAAVADSVMGLSCLTPDRAPLLPTVGILLANIVLTKGMRLAARANADAIRSALATLMDQAFTAITMEGYDLDDAVCRREVMVGLSGRADALPVECGMRIDTDAIKKEYRRLRNTDGHSPTGSQPEFRAARITAVIEPTKPPLDCIDM